MTSRTFASLAVEIEGEGPPVVFVHGLGGSSNSFQTLVGALSGFRLVRLDLPGSARSALPYGKLSLASLVAAVVAAVKAGGFASAHFVGHSLGTLVCQHIAAGHPGLVLSLTLFGPISEPPDAARQGMKQRAQAARGGGMAEIADQVAASGLAAATQRDNPLAVAFVRECILRQDAEAYARTCEALAEARAAEHRLIRCPTLLVTGDGDGVAPPSLVQALAEKIAGSRVELLHQCGHWTPIEKPRECRRLLAEFLAERR